MRMALPAVFNTVNVHALGVGLKGGPAKGTVDFVMTQIVTVPSAHAIIYPEIITATYDGSGQFTVALPVGNDPDVNQQFLYTVTEKPEGSTGRTYPLLIDNAMIGVTQELADLGPAGPVDLAAAYLTQAQADQLYSPIGGAGLNTEAVQDLVADMIKPGTGITVSYDDNLGTFTITSTAVAVSGVSTVNTRSGDVVLTKTDVGLPLADNTADANKPVSGPQSTALAGKANTTHVHAQADVTGLTTSLAGKANTTHTHATTDVTGLDTALAGKQATLTFANLLSGATYTVFKDATTGFWPTSYSASGVPSYTGGAAATGVRPTNRADIHIIWKGPDPSPAVVTSGTAGMLVGVDSRFVTT
jgi:hypothetical protein